jgi:uncharacterized protein with HEPN domain
MSKRVDEITLNEMLERAREIAERTQGITREAFVRDDTLTDAVSYLLIRLATAAERVTPVGKHPEIPWDAILEARDRVLTEYRDVTPDEVWTKARTIAPRIIEALAPR